MVAEAADAADDAPRAAMIAAPRLATVGMKVLLDPRLVDDGLGGVGPPTSALKRSGY